MKNAPAIVEAEEPQVGIATDTWDENILFGLTRSKLAIFIRGYIRGISANKEMCHSCLLVYDYIFYTVVAIEDLYEEWIFQDGMGIDGSYRIFKQVCRIYDYLRIVETECF